MAERSSSHVHAQSGLSGTFYVACGDENVCSIALEDPRAPAAGADMPEIVRKRLGFGVAHTVDLDNGSLIVFPSWLVHSASPRLTSGGERIGISFNADVM